MRLELSFHDLSSESFYEISCKIFPKNISNLIHDVPRFFKYLYEFSTRLFCDYSLEIRSLSKSVRDAYRSKIQEKVFEEILIDFVNEYKKTLKILSKNKK